MMPNTVKVHYKEIKNIGFVPSDWKIKKISEIADFITKGATPTTYGFEWRDSGIPFFKSDCIKDGKFVFGDFEFISEDAHQALSRSKIQSGDILISITGEVGKVAIVPENVLEGNINQHIARIRVNNDSVDSRFIYHWMNQEKVRNYYNLIKTGLAYPQISLQQVRDTEIPIPEIAEQRKIADILSTWDKAIELKEKLIEQKKEQKKGLMQRLLTGKVRFPGFEGEWKSATIEHLCDLYMGKTPSRNEDKYWGKGYKWIAISDMNEKYIKNTKEEITDLALKDTGIKVIPKGTVIMSFKLTLGRLAITDEDMYSNEAIVSFKIKEKDILDNEFLYYFLSSIDITKYGSQAAKGVTLNKDSLKEIKIKYPPINEQIMIRDVLCNCDKEINLLEKELEALKQQKKGLMQLLLTGKVRVRY
jgi:type I restriction enzyme S subunit